MAITLVGLGTEATGNNASLTLTLPTVQNGDVIFALLTGRNGTTGTWAEPSGEGWALLDSRRSTVAGGSLYIFGKRWATGNPTTAAFTWSGGGSNQTTLGQSIAVRGYPSALDIDATTLQELKYSESSSSSYSIESTGTTVMSGDLMLCAAFANNDVVNSVNASACRMTDSSGGEYGTRLGDQTASSLGSDAMQSLFVCLGIGAIPYLYWNVDTAAAAMWVGFKVKGEPVAATATASISAAIQTSRSASASLSALILGSLPPYAGLVCSYQLEPAIISRYGQQLLVEINAAPWPARQITIRTGATLLSEITIVGTTAATIPAGGQGVVVSLSADVDGERIESVIYSGTITGIRDAFNERIVIAETTLASREAKTITAEQIMNRTEVMVRAAPDFFHQPGDLIDDLLVVDSMVTTIGVNQAWFSEYRHG